MKQLNKVFAICSLTLLLTVNAFGGTGLSGTGLGHTINMLKQLGVGEATTLSYLGATNLPETGIPPKAEIPKTEYDLILAQGLEILASGKETGILEVQEFEGGPLRFFKFTFVDDLEAGEVYMTVEEQL